MERSGRGWTVPEIGDQLAQSHEYPLVTLTQERGENVFADPVAPEMVAAVAARMAGGIEIDPVMVRTAGHTVAARCGSRGMQLEAALEPIGAHAAGSLEINGRLRHLVLGWEAVQDTQIYAETAQERNLATGAMLFNGNALWHYLQQWAGAGSLGKGRTPALA